MNKEAAMALKAEIEAMRASTEAEIARITAEAQRADEREQLLECAQQVRGLYEAYLRQGFTEAQAWELVKLAVGFCPGEGGRDA